jgi:tripartite-type tricarboxylate transporter receptor subunit TctC
MTQWTRRHAALGLAAAAALPAAFPVRAQDDAWPSRPVRLVTWSAAGGTIDIFTRLVADHLQKAWGQPVTVDNRVGAAGILATDHVAKSRADGYTILVTAATAQIHNVLLKAKLPYDPDKDLVPLSLLARGRYAFVAPAQAPYGTVREFVEHARGRPQGLSFGSWGQGSAGHLLGVQLAQQNRITLVHAAYKGGDVATVTDMVGGVLDAAFVTQGTAKIHSRSGKIKVLAVAGEGRAPSMPNVPTFADAGFKGFEVSGWIAAFAPAGTPPAVVQKIAATMRSVMAQPAVAARSDELEFEAVGSTAAALMDTQKTDFARWAQMVQASGLKPE